jgi:uncharacterized protein
MKRVILDTNFLMIPSIFKVDIFSEIKRIFYEKYQLFIIDKTIDELNKIIDEQKGKHKDAAKMGLQFIKKMDIKTIKSKTNINVDNTLIEITGENDVVATQDKALKDKLLDKGVGIIVLRKKKYLNMIEV